MSNNINRYWTPPGFRPGPQWDKVQRLAQEMGRLEAEWTEKHLRSLLPEWVLYTMDRWHMTLPCKWYTKLKRIELAKRTDKDGSTIQILVGGKVVIEGHSRVEGNKWSIKTWPDLGKKEDSHGSGS